MRAIAVSLFPRHVSAVALFLGTTHSLLNRTLRPVLRPCLGGALLAAMVMCATRGLAAATPTVTVTAPANNCNTCGPQVNIKASTNFPTKQWQVWLDGQKIYTLNTTSRSFDHTITTTLGVWHKITVFASDTAWKLHAASPVYVCAASAGLAIRSSAVPAGYTDIAYSKQFTATSGTAPYTWSLASGNLPPGLTLAATSGVLDGTPTQAGSYRFVLQVTDEAGATAQATVNMAVHNSAIHLAWVAGDSSVTGYNVYRGTSPSGPFTLLGFSTDPSYTDRSFVPGQFYYFVVTAIGVGGESVYSQQVGIATK